MPPAIATIVTVNRCARRPVVEPQVDVVAGVALPAASQVDLRRIDAVDDSGHRQIGLPLMAVTIDVATVAGVAAPA